MTPGDVVLQPARRGPGGCDNTPGAMADTCEEVTTVGTLCGPHTGPSDPPLPAPLGVSQPQRGSNGNS